jgi:DeoR/GlpR family transcriptional regulator of sugar metabolism
LKQVEKRQQAILELLNRENRIYVSNLSQDFDVSQVTIRKDLKELEDRGLLRRIHGGALKSEAKTAFEDSMETMMKVHSEEKKLIAKCAYSFIQDGDSILLDAATTTLELAHLIRNGDRKDLTIITVAVHIAQELAACDNFRVIQLGGIVRRSYNTVMGPMTTSALGKIHVDKAFIGVSGVDPVVGLTIQNILESEIKRHIIESSTQSFVLADASKMSCIALKTICPVDRVDYIITDDKISPAFVRRLEESGARVVVAKREA